MKTKLAWSRSWVSSVMAQGANTSAESLAYAVSQLFSLFYVEMNVYCHKWVHGFALLWFRINTLF